MKGKGKIKKSNWKAGESCSGLTSSGRNCFSKALISFVLEAPHTLWHFNSPSLKRDMRKGYETLNVLIWSNIMT